jgi:hypothetical protein
MGTKWQANWMVWVKTGGQLFGTTFHSLVIANDYAMRAYERGATVYMRRAEG